MMVKAIDFCVIDAELFWYRFSKQYLPIETSVGDISIIDLNEEHSPLLG